MTVLNMSWWSIQLFKPSHPTLSFFGSVLKNHSSNFMSFDGSFTQMDKADTTPNWCNLSHHCDENTVPFGNRWVLMVTGVMKYSSLWRYPVPIEHKRNIEISNLDAAEVMGPAFGWPVVQELGHRTSMPWGCTVTWHPLFGSLWHFDMGKHIWMQALSQRSLFWLVISMLVPAIAAGRTTRTLGFSSLDWMSILGRLSLWF